MIYLDSNEIRSIILNAHKIKELNKCFKCNGTGFENWNSETGEDIKPGRLQTYSIDRDEGECEKCDGIGFIDLLIYED